MKALTKDLVLVCCSVVQNCDVFILPQVPCVTLHPTIHIKQSVPAVESLKATWPILPMPNSFQ